MRSPDFGQQQLNWFGLCVAMLAFVTIGCAKQNFGVEAQSEEFGQKVSYNTDVDVLWVIDTSSSMDQRQNVLAAQVAPFVDSLNNTGLTYQMAVTTMDMSSTGERGHFLSTNQIPAILSPLMPSLGSILSDRLRIGDNGSPIERGLEAMKAALTSAQSPTSTNAGFMRPGALLNIIFLSDEDDQSTTADYAAFLDQIHPRFANGDRSWIVHFMGVMPNDPNCQTSQWGDSSPGQKYIDLANLSGGTTDSICDADFRGAVSHLKARVLEVITEYPLGRLPKVSSIRIVVDGVAVAQDLDNGWTYNATKNSILFHGAGVPKANAKIRVDFDPAGLL